MSNYKIQKIRKCPKRIYDNIDNINDYAYYISVKGSFMTIDVDFKYVHHTNLRKWFNAQCLETIFVSSFWTTNIVSHNRKAKSLDNSLYDKETIKSIFDHEILDEVDIVYTCGNSAMITNGMSISSYLLSNFNKLLKDNNLDYDELKSISYIPKSNNIIKLSDVKENNIDIYIGTLFESLRLMFNNVSDVEIFKHSVLKDSELIEFNCFDTDVIFESLSKDDYNMFYNEVAGNISLSEVSAMDLDVTVQSKNNITSKPNVFLSNRFNSIYFDFYNALNKNKDNIKILSRKNNTSYVKYNTNDIFIENCIMCKNYESNYNIVLNGMYILFKNREDVYSFLEDINLKTYKRIFDINMVRLNYPSYLFNISIKSFGYIDYNALRTMQKKHSNKSKMRIDVSTRKTKFMKKYDGYIQPFTHNLLLHDVRHHVNYLFYHSPENIITVNEAIEDYKDAYLQLYNSFISTLDNIVNKISSHTNEIIFCAKERSVFNTALSFDNIPESSKRIHGEKHTIICNSGLRKVDTYSNSMLINTYPVFVVINLDYYSDFKKNLFLALTGEPYDETFDFEKLLNMKLSNFLTFSIQIPIMSSNIDKISKLINLCRMFYSGFDMLTISSFLYNDEQIDQINNLIKKM